MPRPRAPNLRAAMITIRPSPEPRSTTRSSARVPASSSMRSTTSSGVVMNGTCHSTSSARALLSDNANANAASSLMRRSFDDQRRDGLAHLGTRPVDGAVVAVAHLAVRVDDEGRGQHARAPGLARLHVAVEQEIEAELHLLREIAGHARA